MPLVAMVATLVALVANFQTGLVMAYWQRRDGKVRVMGYDPATKRHKVLLSRAESQHLDGWVRFRARVGQLKREWAGRLKRGLSMGVWCSEGSHLVQAQPHSSSPLRLQMSWLSSRLGTMSD
jgi:hypothetical protein